MVYVIVSLIAFVVRGVFWAFMCKRALKNKGYTDEQCSVWMFAGFLFGVYTFAIASTKENANSFTAGKISDDFIDNYNEMKRIENGEIWKCSKCGKVNEKNIRICDCGNTRYGIS